MEVLIVDDDADFREMLEARLRHWGYDVMAFGDSVEAWEVLRRPESPQLAILDRAMPGLDGAELCRMVRASSESGALYLIMLTGLVERDAMISGLEAGADDYVSKPFHPAELRARLQVGERVIALQRRLAERVRELEEAVARIRHLEGLLPICSYCKRIRDDRESWHAVDVYISRHAGARFSHGICPECRRRVEAELEQLRLEPGSGSGH